jgi:hypothetical protein
VARSRDDEPQQLPLRETLTQMTVADLKPFVSLLGVKPHTLKATLVDQVAGPLLNEQKVRDLYAGLDELSQRAVQEAAHHPRGILDRVRFAAKYGSPARLYEPGERSWSQKPTRLRLLLPGRDVLPTDLRALLLRFVPRPPELTIEGVDELPAKLVLTYGGDEEEVDLYVRQTERAALLDVKAVLRLIDAGGVKVGEKTRRATQASLAAVAKVLSEGDFYSAEDRSDDEGEGGGDLMMRPFAWPLLVQTAGLASGSTKLELTPAGRKATARPAHEVIQQVWAKWLKNASFDEYSRVDAVKGQQSKGALTAVAPRRQAVAEVLKECPIGKWCRVEELFRVMQAAERPFVLANNPFKLYLCMVQYGHFADADWELMEGRFALAVLFEYAATLGLIDVACIPPAGARGDFHDQWGSDELSCLSRYDGLTHVRLTPLGAWCLGLEKKYEPRLPPAERTLGVLPNLDVVAPDRAPPPADVLLLERFAERRSEAVWHLSKEKTLQAVEQGMEVGELREFLASRNKAGDLPQTVATFLADLEEKAGQLTDLGAARLIECRDAVVARTLANDRLLRGVCQLAGERHLVFRAADEAAVRRALRELGHVLPPGR